jgi:hypothetical protein
MADQTILLYGRTNAGKTALLGELSEYCYTLTGGKTCRLYTADKGGVETIRPYIELGIIDAHILGQGRYATTDPWFFLHNAILGKVKDEKGKWILDKEANDKVGMWAFESARSYAEALMSSMAKKAGVGVSIGGGSNVSFEVEDDGEKIKISGSNMAHFGVAQQRMTDEMWESQKLQGKFLVWTSTVSKDEDTTAAGKVLGPDVIGKALTTEVPRWFNRTFRVDVLPAANGKPERHILYLGTHVDVGAGNAAGLGNIRMALDAPKLEQLTVEPASIVKALKLLDGGSDSAKAVIAKRLNLKA